jgi:cyclopropane fatty-acyl-phospholipid synthase-like methyltransferase
VRPTTQNVVDTADVASRQEDQVREQFENRFRTATLDAAVVVEREAVGSDYGNNGYTTVAQVDGVLPFLDLEDGDRLLDLGSGSGWPGLYIAGRTGCRVVLSDLTVEGMRAATRRADADGLAARTSTVVANGRHLPFRPESFDAIVHTDVLC